VKHLLKFPRLPANSQQISTCHQREITPISKQIQRIQSNKKMELANAGKNPEINSSSLWRSSCPHPGKGVNGLLNSIADLPALIIF
jgi:hypothetical protein